MIAAATLTTIVAAAPAAAADGLTRTSTTLRAGPGSDYPRIARIGSGGPIVVVGCLAGGAWCDVLAAGERGWMPGSTITLLHEGQRIRIADPARIGLPVLTFGMADYWADHYRDRPWFADPDDWRRHGEPPPSGLPTTAPRPPVVQTPPVVRAAPAGHAPPVGTPPVHLPPAATPPQPPRPRIVTPAPLPPPTHVPPIFSPGPIEPHIRSGRPVESPRPMVAPVAPIAPVAPAIAARPPAEPSHPTPAIPAGHPPAACGPGQSGCR
jgi:uncharacterized protein YraI